MTAPDKVESSELRRKAYAIYYDGGLRDRLLAEDPANHGRFLVLDVETGDYEIDARLAEASLRLRERQPRPKGFFGFRIGYPAAFKRSGPWKLEVPVPPGAEKNIAAQRKMESSERRRKAYAIYYDGGLRDRLLAEDRANHGRFLAVDVETGDYEIDAQLVDACLRLRERRPLMKGSFVFRIGYPAAFKRGGPWKPEVEP